MNRIAKQLISSVILALICILPASAQDLVPVSSITGSSSVFVFRTSARVVKRTAPAVKRTRTPTQRIDSIKRINKQYETLAKAGPRINRAKALDPYKLPKNIKTLPAAEGSKLFAGVGEYYLDKADYENAIEYFDQAVQLDAKNITARTGFSQALSVKGNDLLVKDQSSAAKSVFLEALKYDPKNAAAYFGLGEVYADLDQFSEAIANYEKSLENDRGLTEIYVPLGILYYQAGDIVKADQLLTKALAFAANSSETQFFLGLVRASQNRNDEALAAFQKAKTLDPTLAEAFYYSGESLAKFNRSSEAIPDYQKAVALKPNYFDAWLGLGQAFYEANNYPDALVAFTTAKKLKNDNWEALAGLADTYRKIGKFEDAESNYNLAALFFTRIKDFDKTTAADLYSKVGLSIGQQCDINIERAVVCKWSAAIKALQKAVDLTDNAVDHVNLGWAYFRSAHPDAEARNLAAARPNLELAMAELKKAVNAGPPAAEFALQNLGAVQIDLGDFRGAIESLKSVVSKRPDWVFTKYALGTAYFKTNDFENAAKTFRSAAEKDPDNVAVLMGLGYAEIKRKNGKEVRNIIDRLRTLSPNDSVKLDREAKLAKL